METKFEYAIPVLPTPDVAASLTWWTEVCGFTERFRQGDPVAYAGIERDGVFIHLAKIPDPKIARAVGEQTMLRLRIKGIDTLFAEFQRRGAVHPNGSLRSPPWGGRAFDAIDPGGVCVTFTEA